VWAISEIKVIALWCLCAAVAASWYAMNRGAVLLGTDFDLKNFVQLPYKTNEIKNWLIELNKGPEHNQYIHRT